MEVEGYKFQHSFQVSILPVPNFPSMAIVMRSSSFVCTKNLVLSGGDGYIDFRINSDYDEDGADTIPMTATPSGTSSKTDKSHLIVWEITTPG